MSDAQANAATADTLKVQDLCATVGAFRLGPVSLRLERGDYLVLMGPSGCGKTTLLKALAGLLPPVAGEIRLGTVRVDHLPSRRRRFGYVPQHSLLFPHLTVAGNVRFGLRYSGLSRADRKTRFGEVVEFAGVTNLLPRYPATLSGGEARRVALARALAVEPRVLLLDEPLSMLDAEARGVLLESLRGIRRQARMIVLHVTHQQEEAQAVATRYAMMQAGQLIWQGPAPSVVAASSPHLPTNAGVS